MGRTSTSTETVFSATAMILNPIIGPEPISGSSRMKGGSATKILLDSIIIAATTAAAAGRSRKQSPDLNLHSHVLSSNEGSQVSAILGSFHSLLSSIQVTEQTRSLI